MPVGTIPYLASRFAIVDEMKVIPGEAERGTAAETFRRLYWDTALSWKDPVLRMLRIDRWHGPRSVWIGLSVLAP